MLDPPADGAERFGPRLRALRERAGLTQEELAERSGLTPHAVSALERGVRTRPYPHTVRSLASALDVSSETRAALVASVPARGRPAEPAAGPTATSAAAAPPRSEGLVVPPTTLFGRDGDVRAVSALVASGARLVTLTGTGGVGKTRLLAAVTTSLAGGYADGVVQVPLVPVLDPSGLVPAMGRALGLVSGDGPQTLDLVVQHLRDREVLLVLDNFEHLLAGAVDIGHLVSVCARMTVLVSSRAPLRVRGEREYAVVPLQVPPAGATTEAELAASPSGALVLDRARAVSPGRATTPSDVQALVELCRRLAGIPLAIELASTRLRLLDPRSLLDRLEEAATAHGPRDLPARQRTMRATLDWSYGLLAPDEQGVFRVLGVFRAGATLDAVETVCGEAADPARPDVVAHLETLVEHSLVVVRNGPDGRQRFDLLEPVAQYARALLVGAEAARAGRAHARYYAGLAQRAADGYERGDQIAWLARTEADEANLAVAVDRSIGVGDGEPAARITWSLWLYWWMRGQVTFGRHKAEQCLAADLPPALRGRVQLTAATMSFAGGDFATARGHWEEALRLGQAGDDPELTSKGLAGTGLAALASGELALAGRLFVESLPFTAAAGPAGVWMSSLVHVWLGTVLLLSDEPDRATDEIHRGLEVARARGDRLTTYVGLYNLSQVAIAGGDPVAARSYLDEGIVLSEQTQDMANLAYVLDTLAVVEADERQWWRVGVLLGAAQSLRESVGSNVYGYYKPDESLRAHAAAAAAAALGPDRYGDAVDEGCGLGLSDLVRYARAGGTRTTPA